MAVQVLSVFSQVVLEHVTSLVALIFVPSIETLSYINMLVCYSNPFRNRQRVIEIILCVYLACQCAAFTGHQSA